MRFKLLVPILVAILGVFGCDNSGSGKPKGDNGHSHSHEGDDHGHEGHSHDDPGHEHKHDGDTAEGAKVELETLTAKEGVKVAVTLAEQIREAVSKGEGESVHTEIHAIGELLESLAGKGASESLAEELQGEHKGAADAMFAVIEKIDEALHDNKELPFDQVQEAYDAALESVKAVSGKL